MGEQAFWKANNPVREKMYRLALRLLVSKEAAEDAVQEVFVKLWDGKEKMETYRNPNAYAMTMIKNYCYDQLKLKYNQHLRIVHTNYEDSNQGLQEQVEAHDEYEQVRILMEALPKQQQTIVQLRDIEDFEYEEIAEIMEMNQTAVRVNLSRARKTLREELLKKHNYGTEKN